MRLLIVVFIALILAGCNTAPPRDGITGWREDISTCLVSAEQTVGASWVGFARKAASQLDPYTIEHYDYKHFQIVMVRPGQSHPDHDFLRCKLIGRDVVELETRISGKYNDWINIKRSSTNEESPSLVSTNTVPFSDFDYVFD